MTNLPSPRLPLSFFRRDAAIVARDLLGTELVHQLPDGPRRVRIVETEAYLGPHDLACHATAGRTARTAVMFGPPGRAYVYLIYGLHDMINVVVEPEGRAAAVLLRAGEPLVGIDGRTDGPGRLARALGVTVAEHDGCDLRGKRLWLEPGAAVRRVQRTPRVGVAYSGIWAAAPLRFLDADSPSVSRPRWPGGARPRGRQRPAGDLASC